MNFISTFKIYGVIGLVVAMLLGGSFFYNKYQQRKIESLGATIETLNGTIGTLNTQIDLVKEANATNLETIGSLVEEYNNFAASMEELRGRMNSAERGTEVLRETLRESDLQKLSNAKPGLIERRVNDATDNVFEDLESITTPDP